MDSRSPAFPKTRRLAKLSALLLAGIACLSAMQPARAMSAAQCQVAPSDNNPPSGYGPNGSFQETTNAAGAATSCDTELYDVGALSATAQTTASAGSLHTYADVTGGPSCVPGSCPGPRRESHATGSYDDTLMIVLPVLPPGVVIAGGMVDVTFYMHGSQSALDATDVYTNLVGGVMTPLVGVFQSCGATLSGTQSDVTSSCVATAPWAAATPTLSINESLAGNAFSYILSSPGAVSNFTNTAGVSEIQVFDSAGNLIPNVTITSTSGFAYPVASAVPLPSSLGLMAMGLIGLGCSAWRRRSDRAASA